MLVCADPAQVDGLSRFFKTGPGQYGEGDKFLGIKVPVTREVVKRCWREVGFPELEECIRSEYHEVRLAALLTLVEIFAHAKKRSSGLAVTPAASSPKSPDSKSLSVSSQTSPASRSLSVSSLTSPNGKSFSVSSPMSLEACVAFYLSHTDWINNWDLVDLSCYPLLGEWLLDKDRSLLYELARNGRTLWEQRIGIVSTMTFIRHGQLDDTFAIADILLHHPHDLIHKAVGWLLREAGKRDRAALEAWLQASDPTATPTSDPCPQASDPTAFPTAPAPVSRYRSMPRTMLRYAIEKFPEPIRCQYLQKP